MKTLLGTLIAFGLFASAANASIPAPVMSDTVVEYGCRYGY